MLSTPSVPVSPSLQHTPTFLLHIFPQQNKPKRMQRYCPWGSFQAVSPSFLEVSLSAHSFPPAQVHFRRIINWIFLLSPANHATAAYRYCARTILFFFVSSLYSDRDFFSPRDRGVAISCVASHVCASPRSFSSSLPLYFPSLFGRRHPSKNILCFPIFSFSRSRPDTRTHGRTRIYIEFLSMQFNSRCAEFQLKRTNG